MGGPSAGACSYTSPLVPSSPTMNWRGSTSTDEILHRHHAAVDGFLCEAIRLTLTCNVLSNQRLPLFQRAPPPCSICAATRLQYSSSDVRGIGASRQTVKMLFWMARTDSLFVLSEEEWWTFFHNVFFFFFQMFHDMISSKKKIMTLLIRLVLAQDLEVFG